MIKDKNKDQDIEEVIEIQEETENKEEKSFVPKEEYDKIKNESEVLKDLAQQFENQVKRTVADYQNLEKRTLEDKREWIRSGNRDLILKLLPVKDLLEKAVKGAKESGEKSGWLQGIEMTIQELNSILKQEGLEPVETEIFNPNLHEAVETKPGAEGVILDVLQLGYNLNGKLLRPAKVVVGK